MKDEYFGEVIYIYTSAQAEADDILVDIIKINPKWINGIFNYITTNLLHKGYFDNDKINIPNLLDLLNQALQIVKEKTNNLQEFDSFFSGKIELPNGEKQEIFIELNETNRFTIMLPEDR